MKYINIEILFNAVNEANPTLTTEERVKVWDLCIEFGDKLEEEMSCSRK